VRKRMGIILLIVLRLSFNLLLCEKEDGYNFAYSAIED
jgi:hypothetical protein